MSALVVVVALGAVAFPAAAQDEARLGEPATPTDQSAAIAAGSYHSCAIKTDRTIACWGNNVYGESDAPAGEFIAISAGWVHSCGIRADRIVTCWSWNEDGQADAPSGRFGAVGDDMGGGLPVPAVPGAPRSLSVTRGDGTLSVSWSPPASDGGHPITGYRSGYWDDSRGSGGDGIVTGTSATFAGLDNGATYEVSVVAINRHGEGDWVTTTIAPYRAETALIETVQIVGGRSVRLEVGGDARGGGRCRSASCRWFDVHLAGDGWNPNGAYQPWCHHSGVHLGGQYHPPQYWQDKTVVFADGRKSSDTCFFGFINRQVHVEVDGIRSNTVVWPRPGQAPLPEPQPDLVPQPGKADPSPPQNVVLEVVESSGKRRLKLAWEEPEDDGGSPIERYVVRFSPKGHSPFHTRFLPVNIRRYSSPFSYELGRGATYTATIKAINEEGRSSEAVTLEATIDATAPCADATVVWARGSGQHMFDNERIAFIENGLLPQIPYGISVNAYELGQGGHGYEGIPDEVKDMYPAVGLSRWNMLQVVVDIGTAGVTRPWPQSGTLRKYRYLHRIVAHDE